MLNYQELKVKVIGSFRQRMDGLDNVDEEKLNNIIYEVVENLIPTQHHKILQLALTNLNLVYNKPSRLPSSSNDCPINQIIANIYDSLSKDLLECNNSKR